MKRLCLLRHSKAKRDEGPDLERPLMKRGRKDASLIGTWLLRKSYIPGVVLCSPSRRTRETYDELRRHLDGIAEPHLLKSLYLAPPSALMARIRSVPDSVETVLVIGHNPGLQKLAIRLAGPGSKAGAVRKVGKKFPTSALAIFEADIGNWRELDESKTRLVRLVRAGDLP